VAFVLEPYDDAGAVLERAERFLASDPVQHNLVLTLLRGRVANPEPGRYWVVAGGGEPGHSGVAGVVLQSPLDFHATLTPMPAGAAVAAARAIAAGGADLPGVLGDAATAARFAGAWTEHRRSAATPVWGQRIYELAAPPIVPGGVPGGLRRAAPADRDLVLAWNDAFSVEIGDCLVRPELVDRRLAAGHLWLWEQDGPVSLAGHAPPAAGVVRIGPVYTPPDHRRRGYAAACVAAVSGAHLVAGARCILYADLANPVSNSVYRRIGYRAVAEILRYRFG
jgi:predicted GNAT family acetyltransferase